VSDRLGTSGEELTMSSRLQSNGITPAAKVGTLILLAIFHSFLAMNFGDEFSGDGFWRRISGRAA
jgi:hypothetical protein